MNKLKIFKLFVIVIVLAAIIIGCSYVFVNVKISNLEENTNNLPYNVQQQQKIVNDLNTVRCFYYVPFVNSKAFWAYNNYLSKFERMVNNDYSVIESKNTDAVYSYAISKTNSINENQLRNSLKDSIINAGLANLEQNPLGSSKESFCDKWSIAINFLKESGYSHYNFCR